MKDIIRQIAVVLSVLVTVIVNILANALPLNGLNTGEISDRFEVYFVPAGYVFSIWGLIYIGLIAYAVFQALPSQRQNPRLRATGWWTVLAGLANSVWIFLWHYEQFPATLAAMLVLLASLIVTYLRLGTGRTTVSPAEKWAVRIPFSIYLGWITVATIANVTSLLDYPELGWFWDSPRNLDVDHAWSGAGDFGLDGLEAQRCRFYTGDPVGAGGDCDQVFRGGSCSNPNLDHLWAGGADPGGQIILDP